MLLWLARCQAQRDAENCVSDWGDVAGWVDTLPAWRGNAAPIPPVGCISRAAAPRVVGPSPRTGNLQEKDGTDWARLPEVARIVFVPFVASESLQVDGSMG